MQLYNFLNDRGFTLLLLASSLCFPLVSFGQTPPPSPSHEWDMSCDFKNDALFSRYRKISIGPLQTDLELPCDGITALAELLNRGADKLKSHLTFPEGMTLIVIESQRKLASYRVLTKELTITSEYLNAADKNPDEIMLLVGVIWHELGHGLFFENFAPGELRKSLGEFAEKMNLANSADITNQKSREKYFDAQGELDSMKSAQTGHFSASEIENKESEVRELKNSWLKAMKTFSDLSRSATELVPRLNALRGIVSPFNELFGDLMAVGMTGDLEVIRDALWRDDLSDEKKAAHLQRSFSLIENMIDNWFPSSIDEYNVLAPTRFYLGTRLKEKSLSERVDIIINSFRVISRFSEAEIQAQESGNHPSVNSPITLNRRLIKKLEEQ